MSRVIRLKVEDVREHPYRKDRIEVKVKIPTKAGFDNTQWVEPNMHEVKRLFRIRGDNLDVLIGRSVRIPELEQEAEKMGYKMMKKRRWKG